MPSSANSERPTAIAADSAATSDDVSPWPSLHADLVELIGWRLLAAGDLLDYVRYRAVCTHWRSSAISPHGRGIVDPRFHPRRWLLLPEGHGLHPDDGKKTLFNLCTGVSVCTRLPLSTDCRLLDSVDGLLLVQWGKQDSSMIRLLHPFTGDFAELPPLMSLVRAHMDKHEGRQRQWVDFQCVTSVSVSSGGVIAVMITISSIYRVFFATTKDKQWSVSTWSVAGYSKSIAIQGKLYMSVPRTKHGRDQQILQFDPPRYDYNAMSSSLLPPKVICTSPMDKICGKFSIAECDSEILLIGYDAKTNFADRLLLYRVSDIVMGKVVPVTSIGGKTIFLTIDNRISSRDDDIFVYLRETMTSDYKAIPNMPGDTIVRRRRLKDNTPIQYELGSGKWSQTTLWCKDSHPDCNCGLVYHIYDCCHCADWHVQEAMRMEQGKAAKAKVEMVQKWTPPVGNYYMKVHVDSGYDNVAGSGTTGVVIRNQAGNLVRAQALWYERAADPRAMEALALKDGLRLASDLRFSHILIESDALEVVNMCNRNTFERADIGGVFKEIKQLEESFSSCLVSHVPRQANKAAHLCAKQANSSRRRCLWVNYIPAFLRECMHH